MIIRCVQADFEAVKATKKYVEKFVQHGEGNPIDLDNHFLTLLDKCLGTTSKALIWKGNNLIRFSIYLIKKYTFNYQRSLMEKKKWLSSSLRTRFQ